QLRPDSIDPVQNQLLYPGALGRVGQDDVYKGIPHVRRASHRLDIRRSDQRAYEGFGDFGFNQLRTSRPLDVDDDLRVGNVGNGIEWSGADRVKTKENSRSNKQQNENSEPDNIPDNRGEHKGVASLPLVDTGPPRDFHFVASNLWTVFSTSS